MDDITINTWLPASFYYDDVFHPYLAGPLVEGLRGLSDESSATVLAVWGMNAAEEAERERN